MQAGTENLPYGIYFGASQIRRELPGFSVSLLMPTLRAEDGVGAQDQHKSVSQALCGRGCVTVVNEHTFCY